VKYGLEDVIDALLQYLETQGEVEDDRLRVVGVPEAGG